MENYIFYLNINCTDYYVKKGSLSNLNDGRLRNSGSYTWCKRVLKAWKNYANQSLSKQFVFHHRLSNVVYILTIHLDEVKNKYPDKHIFVKIDDNLKLKN